MLIRMNREAFARLVLFGLLLLAALEGASAQHGGKAEPRRVQFKTGASSAISKGRVRGSEEAEYALAARARQRLVLRLVSAPARSASPKAFDPDGSPLELVRERDGETWSATLPKSGDYLFVIHRPAGGAGATSYTLTVTIPPPASRSKATEPLEEAMRRFVVALEKTDAELFLSLFSRVRPFYANNPLNEYRARVTYAELERDIRGKQGMYFDYLERGDGGAYDAFVDHVTTTGAVMWRRVEGNKYVPPDGAAASHAYVKWRMEDGRWVIDEISYSQA